MFYEVFLPSAESEGFDVTMTVEADNWMQALKTGLARTGEGEDAIRNVMCDIKDDNSIHVTDATSRRVFVLKEMSEEESEAFEEEAEEELKTVRMDAPDFAKPIASANQAPTRPTPAVQDQPGERVPTQPGVQQEVQKKEEERRAQEARRQEEQRQAEEERRRQAEEAERQRLEAERQRQEAERQRQEQARREAEEAARREAARKQAEEAARREAEQQAQRAAAEAQQRPAQEQPQASEPSDGFDDQRAKDSEEAWRRIGSSTYEALRKDSEEAKVVREQRVPTGQRKAVEIGRGDEDESVSENILEEVFLEINRIHEGEMAMEEVVNYVMDMAMEKIRAEAGSIMFADVNGQELYFATARGPKAHEVMNFRVPMGTGVVGFCAREGVSLAISDAEKDPRFYKDISDALGYETKSLCCAPVQFEGRVYGAIELLNKDTQHFSSTEVNVLTYIGRQLAKYVHDLIMAREKLE